MGRTIGLVFALILAGVVVAGGRAAPNDAATQFADRAWAPPMAVRVDGAALFVHPQTLEDRLARRYADDTTRRVGLDLLASGRYPFESLPREVVGFDALPALLAHFAGER